ncbi:MAG: D-amino acid dehydrogenase, partial [Pseudomonadota bacterium]
VLGAGITGITTAYSLLRRGHQVTVIERNRYAAMETSFANGGQLSASNAEVWTRWATVFKGLKWMFEPGAPLLVNPRPSWHKYSWMAEFMAAIPKYEQNTVDTVRLALKAREVLEDHARREGFAFDCEHRGILHVYRDERDLRAARKVSKLLAKGGLNREEITASEARSMEPALTGPLCGAIYTKDDFTGDVHRYTMGLAQACARRGATLRFSTTLKAIAPKAGGVEARWTDAQGQTCAQFDGVVVCAGVHSRDIARQLGDRVNVYPVKGYSITVNLDNAASQAAAPRVSLLDDQAKIVTSRLGDNRLRIAGTAEFNGYNRDIRADRIAPLTEWCADLFPQVSTEHVVPWAGLRPMMPNMMPKVGPGRAPGVFYNTGHGHLGWTLGAATAELVGDMVDAAQPAQPIAQGAMAALAV